MNELLTIVSAAVLLLAGCNSQTYKGGAIHGTLIDASSRASIEDAYVAIYWGGWVSSLAATSGQCLHVGIAKTDADGRFLLPAWDSRKTNVSDVSAAWFVFKPGYDFQIGESSNINGFVPLPEGQYLVNRIDEPDEWIQKMIGRVPSGCGREDNQTLKAQIAFYDAMISLVKSASDGVQPAEANRDGKRSVPIREIQQKKCLTLQGREELSASDPALGSERGSEVYIKCMDQL